MGQRADEGVPGQQAVGGGEEQGAPAGAAAPGQAAPQRGGQGQRVGRQGQDQAGREVPQQEAGEGQRGEGDGQQEAGPQRAEAEGAGVQQLGGAEGQGAWGAGVGAREARRPGQLPRPPGVPPPPAPAARGLSLLCSAPSLDPHLLRPPLGLNAGPVWTHTPGTPTPGPLHPRVPLPRPVVGKCR